MEEKIKDKFQNDQEIRNIINELYIKQKNSQYLFNKQRQILKKFNLQEKIQREEMFMNDEYARLLKNGGIVVEVSAGSDHLKELKSIIYDEVFPQNKKQSDFSDNFSLLCEYDRRFEITLIQNQLKALLAMTPHIHRINREQSERLEALDSLELTVNYKIRVLGKGRG